MKVTLNKELKMKVILIKELTHTLSIANRRVFLQEFKFGMRRGSWELE